MLKLIKNDESPSSPEFCDPEHLLNGMTAGAKLAPDTLFSRGSQLVVDASHVQVVEHNGLSVIPVEEVFSDTDAVFLGFGFPNVYVAIPRGTDSELGRGWDRLAAFMFFRQQAFVADTKGRVQGGMLVELRGLPETAKLELRKAMSATVGKRHISCANAIGRTLSAAGFTCGGRKLSRKLRPMRLARTIWEKGLEFEGEPVDIRLIRTNAESLTEHFAGVIRKEATSGCRAVKKAVAKKGSKNKAPIIEPRQIPPAVDGTKKAVERSSGDSLELLVGRPSRLAALLRVQWGEHPIFDVRTPDDSNSLDHYESLSTPMKAYPGKLDLVTRLKRHLLFSKPVVRLIRSNMAAEMESLGKLPGPTLVEMLQVGTPEEPFVYNLVLTSTSVRATRLENRSKKDNEKANWVLAKHVLLSGYDPDVRFAGELWAEDTPDGRLMYVSNNSGTYQPTPEQTEAARDFLSKLFETPGVCHIV